jgi:lipopolysaccharide transport system permease protein
MVLTQATVGGHWEVVDTDDVGNDAETIWVRRPQASTLINYFADVWRYRALFPFLFRHSLNTVYAKSILGIGWLIIRPLILSFAAALVIKGALGLSTAPVPYLLFVLTSLSLWLTIQVSMAWGTKSIQRTRRLIRQFSFPRLIAHVTALAPSVVEFAVVFFAATAAAIYFAVTGAYVVDLGLHTFAVFIALGMAFLFVLAVTLLTTVLNNMARDTWYGFRYVLTAWSLFTPVYYARSSLPPPWNEYLLLNPITPIMELYRWSFFYSEPMRWDALALSFCVTLILLVLGLWFFVKFEPRLVDAI